MKAKAAQKMTALKFKLYRQKRKFKKNKKNLGLEKQLKQQHRELVESLGNNIFYKSEAKKLIKLNISEGSKLNVKLLNDTL